MDKRKIIGIIVIVLALVIAGAVYFATNRNTSPSPAVVPVFNPKNPPFILGTVVTASVDKIQFTVGPTTDTAVIASGTKLVKQVVDKQGVPVVVPATLADFQPKARIEVYFTQPPKNGIYGADKVQIISE